MTLKFAVKLWNRYNGQVTEGLYAGGVGADFLVVHPDDEFITYKDNEVAARDALALTRKGWKAQVVEVETL